MKKVKLKKIDSVNQSGQEPEALFKNKNNKANYEQISLEQSLVQEDLNIDKKSDRSEIQKKNESKNEPLQEKNKESDIILSTEAEKLEEAQEAVKSQKSKKKKWTSIIGLLINLLVVGGLLTYQLLTEDGEVSSFSDLISNINWGIFVLVILCYILIQVLIVAVYSILLKKSHKKNKPILACKTHMIGRYYDSITPLGTGGQPFQIYYMSKRGVSGSDALSVCMGKYVIGQISYAIFTLSVLIYSVISSSATATTGTTVVTATSWIGFALNAALILLVGLVSINKRVGNKLVSGCLKLLHKMKIVKNYDKQYVKVQKTVADYQSTMKFYAKDVLTFISIMTLSFLSLLATYTLPFLIHASFYGFHPEVFGQIFVYCVMVDLSASFVPLPGGTGASELSFTVLFSQLFGGGNLFWAMLIWRIFTYYIYIFQGIGIMIYDSVHGNKKLEWQKRKWALEKESREFEAKELKDFELSLEKKRKKEKRK